MLPLPAQDSVQDVSGQYFPDNSFSCQQIATSWRTLIIPTIHPTNHFGPAGGILTEGTVSILP